MKTSQQIETGLSGTVNNCAVLTVSNGSVSAYPSCAITCKSGYILSASACVPQQVETCAIATVANGSVAAFPGCAITCHTGFVLTGNACLEQPAPVCAVTTVANGTVSAYPGCAVSCNSGFALLDNACVAQPAPTCAIATVDNGVVAAYPGCAITCNSGYSLSGNACAVIVVQSSGGGGGGGGGGSAPSAPTAVSAVNAPMAVTPAQTGTATNIFAQGEVKLTVPVGSISQPTTFTVNMVAGAVGEVPDDTTGAFMVGNKVINITAKDAGGAAVRNFNNQLTIAITLPDLPADTSDLAVYYFDDTQGVWVLVPGAVFDPITKKVTIQVNHLTRFAVLKAGKRLSVPLRASVPVKTASSTIATPVKPVGIIAVVPVKTASPSVGTSTVGQVLGLKAYAEGTLLRSKTNKKIYVVAKNKLAILASIKELAKYKGKKIIDVDQTVIDNYNKPSVAAVKAVKFAEGALLRSKTTNQLYTIVGGKKVQLITFAQFTQFIGKLVTLVDESVLKGY